MKFLAGDYQVAVIGAGHAGIEAALASARLGCRTVVFTLNLDWIANVACNPSIGGTSKGHLVREIDALGGEMGKAADSTLIQSRMLNSGKGPAVHSLRAQIDRRKYSEYMKHTLEKCKNLDLKQAEIVDLKRTKDGRWELTTHLDAIYLADAVIISTGTFLNGKIFVGDKSFSGGPDGMFPAVRLGEALKKLNIPLRRFKTGTPPRVNALSIDYSRLEAQPGDEKIVPFSFETRRQLKNKVVCYITYTNEKTKQIILDNLHRSPLYSGEIEGVGPRYCPSIEDKIVRFKDKERHQIFLEPCGLNTEEVYLQGMSSSLPEDVQYAFVRTIKGLENVKIMRPAYAIEYDCVDPLYLKPTLELMYEPMLYGAGQFNGSSGYEEAAAQGIVAGINAARKVQGKSEIIFSRTESYIGTLIDDLVTKGCQDPYRMMTSRSEYRLVLRQDNADLRLTQKGYEIGLISEKRYKAFLKKKAAIEDEYKRMSKVIIPPIKEVNDKLQELGTAPIETGVKLSELLKRPQVTYSDIKPFDKDAPDYDDEVFQQVEIMLKYEGYIKRQNAQIQEIHRLESKLIPEDIDYSQIIGLRKEAIEKLSKIRPVNVGQASRISGVSPADISVLLIYLSRLGK
ncbi:MAG: tRNA uridine-5-carboxymethylaminomethyl(34) synthesis enzyme MnmG [Clostridiales bacterium]|mgnify:FL=1|jgi:tRNA uridine 5-carboxymethylaminomethyl modification enzyme|nr:tRNA uridine-5-carboxymethylaminomethyl(34) synthesis enzyme MnmG [Clostridiales bacterium]HOA33573.1 tRNA uridine-5-carboxymethylaminomethyl(34) synthesis enzyme MnmG [Clostridiales bacterium]HOJ35884.1 tRNA uridine-5-carboxymethylaminomethyl(34) synthesis enzyme MnmG [Clostridiales bacterium]HPP68237.1 tRNA uridine-5-carboxymethylaminomethyl(34) synthesis enzyme MnmG [Clostridiales bacterium]HQA05115.1 tRNA uridine-5-carboxymethylaminomethyl(34) synthesis enzyme MnmG [Clostridiales bacteri